MVFHTDMDAAALSEFLLEGSFDATSSDLGSEDSLDYDAPVEFNYDTKETTSIREEFHAMHRPNFAERTTKYLEKLYCMLEQCPESIAAWTPDGSSFAILDSDALEKSIIPRFFKPIKFESFVRQLNSYGFRKAKYTVQNRVVFAFRHTDFLRGQSHQLQTIKRRRRVKRTSETQEPTAPAPAMAVAATVVPNVNAALGELMTLVRTLQQDLADTKALVNNLLGGPHSSQVIAL
ncbi:Aste57867_12055 [Aphanomyces stellatus]|uniref:Aste57867_12055 protein n=1 Tax=Aphanomyces stellatus TaxID=120398 RepID=A0A485KVS4_9STRA|nr:hypothetical protein As57867_012010 [Aphanomyces stellatus]VFT88910.1 Aste57867_12055 [Aphanomyces stellatus]